MIAFEPLVKCPGLELDDSWCGTLIDETAKSLCGWCARRESPKNPRRSLPDPKPPVNATPNPNGAGKPASPADPPLVPCVGVDGSGCPDAALVARTGTRKRCQACEALLARWKAKEGRALSGPLPEWIRRARREREAERERAAKR